MSPVDLSNLSNEQIEALREVLLQVDKGRSENVFDLSKPPKEPYKHQEYPKVMYGHDGKRAGHVITVKSAEEEQQKLEEGYSNDPHPHHDYSRIDRNSMKAPKVEVPVEVSEEDEAEARVDVDAAAEKFEAEKKAAKGRGRGTHLKPREADALKGSDLEGGELDS